MRRRTADRRHDLRVGLALLVLLVPAVYLGFVQAIPFRSHYEVDAVFASAATQLKEGAPVRIAGVDVGEVTAVRRGAGTTARVTVRIEDRGRPLPVDTTMKIRPRLFLEGNFYVEARPGTATRELEDGDIVPLSQTAIPVQFDQVLSTFDRTGRQDLQAVLRELSAGLDGGGRALNRTYRAAPRGLEGLARSAAAVRGVAPGDLARFVRSTATTSRALTMDPEVLGRFVDALGTTMVTLAGRTQRLTATLDAVDGVLARAPRLAGAAASVVVPVRRLSRALAPALEEVPRSLPATTRLLRGVRPLLGDAELPRLARTLTPALADLAAQRDDLDGLLRTLEPVATCLEDKVLPVLRSEVDDGGLSSGLQVWEELVRFPVSLASNSATFNGNGHILRLGVGNSEQTLTPGPQALGDIVTTSDRPVVGARPRYVPGRTPPFRPDSDCRRQPVQDLAASALKAPASTPVGARAKREAGAVARGVARALERKAGRR